jgi:hypothetical protein
MKADDKEFDEMRCCFEREYKCIGRITHERNKILNSKGFWYEDGNINNLFRAYMSGYALGQKK